MHPLGWIGLVLEIFGAASVALGVYDTFKIFHAKGGEWHYIDRLSIWYEWLRRHVLQRPPRMNAGRVDAVAARFRVTASGYAATILPDITVHPRKFAAEAQRAFTKLQADYASLTAELQREAEAREEGLEHVQRQLETTAASLRERIQEVEVSGLRLEVVGLAFVVFGTVLSAIGSALT